MSFKDLFRLSGGMLDYLISVIFRGWTKPGARSRQNYTPEVTLSPLEFFPSQLTVFRPAA